MCPDIMYLFIGLVLISVLFIITNRRALLKLPAKLKPKHKLKAYIPQLNLKIKVNEMLDYGEYGSYACLVQPVNRYDDLRGLIGGDRFTVEFSDGETYHDCYMSGYTQLRGRLDYILRLCSKEEIEILKR